MKNIIFIIALILISCNSIEENNKESNNIEEQNNNIKQSGCFITSYNPNTNKFTTSINPKDCDSDYDCTYKETHPNDQSFCSLNQGLICFTGCTTNSDCPNGWICDYRSEVIDYEINLSAIGNPVCTNPECTYSFVTEKPSNNNEPPECYTTNYNVDKNEFTISTTPKECSTDDDCGENNLEPYFIPYFCSINQQICYITCLKDLDCPENWICDDRFEIMDYEMNPLQICTNSECTYSF